MCVYNEVSYINEKNNIKPGIYMFVLHLNTLQRAYIKIGSPYNALYTAMKIYGWLFSHLTNAYSHICDTVFAKKTKIYISTLKT